MPEIKFVLKETYNNTYMRDGEDLFSNPAYWTLGINVFQLVYIEMMRRGVNE